MERSCPCRRLSLAQFGTWNTPFAELSISTFVDSANSALGSYPDRNYHVKQKSGSIAVRMLILLTSPKLKESCRNCFLTKFAVNFFLGKKNRPKMSYFSRIVRYKMQNSRITPKSHKSSVHTHTTRHPWLRRPV